MNLIPIFCSSRRNLYLIANTSQMEFEKETIIVHKSNCIQECYPLKYLCTST